MRSKYSTSTVLMESTLERVKSTTEDGVGRSSLSLTSAEGKKGSVEDPRIKGSSLYM